MIDVAATLDFTKTSTWGFFTQYHCSLLRAFFRVGVISLRMGTTLGLSIADAQELNAHYLEAHGGDRAAITDASGIHHIGSCHHRLFPGRGHHPVDPVPPLRSVATGEDPGGIGFHEVIPSPSSAPLHFPFRP